MKRGLFTIAAAVSLLVAILVLVDRLFQQSYETNYMYRVYRDAGDMPWVHEYYVQTGGGNLIFGSNAVPYVGLNQNPEPEFVRSVRQTLLYGGAPRTLWLRLGFAIVNDVVPDLSLPDTSPHGIYRRMLMVPNWFLILLLLILPAMWVRKYRRSFPPGHCQVCGYDLRASADRCPECGTEVNPKSEARNPKQAPMTEMRE